jgi:cytochrome b pre-mRNA-processing protein 3
LVVAQDYRADAIRSCMRLVRFWRRDRHERAGFVLYGIAVAAARDPFFYARLGVPDTLDGRFDLVGLHVFLLIRRLRRLPPPGPDLAQAVFDAMFSDMDVNLREMGVGDLSVGKRVRAMWEAFHGRAKAYDAALDASDPAALEAALSRNVWRAAPAPGAAALARLAVAQADHLAGQALAAFTAGHADFMPAAEAAA